MPSSIYFARIRVKGKLIRKSLKTDTLTVAKLRLADMEKMERQRAESRADVTHGKLTFGEAVKIYRQRISGDVSMKPRTKEYYEERSAALLKSWPEPRSAWLRASIPGHRITRHAVFEGRQRRGHQAIVCIARHQPQ